MKKVFGIVFMIVIAMGIWGIGQAVVPPSTSLEAETKAQNEREKLMSIINKFERHEEENLNFLKEIKSEMKGLKS